MPSAKSPAEVQLFNTMGREKQVLRPIEPGKVKLYACGPTVYHFAHIGNMRAFVFNDVLVRTLRYAGYEVDFVMNITDVGHLTDDGNDGEDKMEKGSRRTGKTAWEIAEFYTEAFLNDCQALNLTKPTHMPRATKFIDAMIEMVQKLEAKGYTYKTSDGVYFDTKKFPRYGELAKLDIENLEAGIRVDMGEKKNATDFALWKFSPENEQRQMEWDSPWGRGFPGWHIECSAMSRAYLGDTFDIHCGGKDHITVHHPNEIAQSECANDAKFVNIWMHNEFLNDSTGKMSKSNDEFLSLPLLIKKGYSAMDYRYLLLQAHYRTEISFHFKAMDSAKAGLAGLYRRLQNLQVEQDFTGEFTPAMQEYQQKFSAALFDDLNTPVAVSVLFDLLKSQKTSDAEKKALAIDFDNVLGLRLCEAMEKQQVAAIPDDVQALVDARDAARTAKNWAESDRLRDELQRMGYEVKDSAQGTLIAKK